MLEGWQSCERRTRKRDQNAVSGREGVSSLERASVFALAGLD
jgi:hypothetical protein